MRDPNSPHLLLSAREIQVLELFSRGLNYRDTGVALAISTETVRKHACNIYVKLRVKNKTLAIIKFKTLKNYNHFDGIACDDKNPGFTSGDVSGATIKRGRRSNAELGKILGDREAEVLALCAEGKRYSEIAAELFISTETVRTHLRNIYKRLGVKNITQALLEFKSKTGR